MNTPVLHCERIYYTYPDGQAALRGIDLTVTAGERVALVGANSAGKSTLLLLCNGCLWPTQGRVLIHGEPLTTANIAHMRRRVGSVFQNAEDQLFMPTVAEDVAFGPRNLGLDADAVRMRIHAALAAVDATHLAPRPPHKLSGGEQRAAAIATALALEPNILLLDEPTANLDPRARRTCLATLDSLPHTLIVATHDMELARALCPRTVALFDGQIMADAPTAHIFADTALLDTCHLL